jgi:UDP-glucose 4-epimerase
VDLVAAQADCMSSFNGLTFNVGGGAAFSLSLKEMTAACESLTGKVITIGSIEVERPADLRVYMSDTRKIEQHCQWKPSRGPDVVLSDIYRWMREHQQLVGPALFAPTS